MTNQKLKRQLFYGDNLDVLRKNKIKDETIDLCYIDPPFNSKRNYFQIYNNLGKEDLAQAQAFIDTWSWSSSYTMKAYDDLKKGYEGKFTTKTIDLIDGLHRVLGEGSLLAYLVNMTVRIVEIHRVLKPTGSFYLHCDPTASHYLKIILDTIFCGQGGIFLNEIIWCYRGGGSPKRDFGRRHDVIFRYAKSDQYYFNSEAIRIPYQAEGINRTDDAMWGKHKGTNKVYRPHPSGKIPEDWWLINTLNANDPERLGYPTQKPEALLERIIQASSKEGDTILDAFCGCGTTIAVAEKFNRNWIGIDITYQSIGVVLRRLKKSYGKKIEKEIIFDGVPKDIESAIDLANKKDDRVRKEFEKWAILTYTDNHGIINDKKGADKGIDGVAYFTTSKDKKEKIIFQVKSGNVNRSTISTLRGDMVREKAAIAILITLQEPTKPMKDEAATDGLFVHPLFTNKKYNKIQIVTIKEIIEKNKKLEIGLSINTLKDAKTQSKDKQLSLDIE